MNPLVRRPAVQEPVGGCERPYGGQGRERLALLEPGGRRREAERSRAKAEKAKKLISRVANQQGVDEGKTRYWCSACMKSFLADAGEIPEACPEGDGAEAAEPVPAEV